MNSDNTLSRCPFQGCGTRKYKTNGGAVISQCFDFVCWVSGRALGLYKPSTIISKDSLSVQVDEEHQGVKWPLKQDMSVSQYSTSTPATYTHAYLTPLHLWFHQSLMGIQLHLAHWRIDWAGDNSRMMSTKGLPKCDLTKDAVWTRQQGHQRQLHETGTR